MGYLNNTVLTVDAILTKKGREALAKNDGSFRITQFALADDEIDYTLYNPNHPSGSAFYGIALDNLPLLEAFPDETQVMKYKLTTLPRGTAKMPVLGLGTGAVILKQGETLAITPQTLNFLGSNNTVESNGYTAIIADVRTMSEFNAVGVQNIPQESTTTTLGTNISKTVVGTTITLTATTVNTLFGTNEQLTTTLTVIGRDSGARLTIPVTVKKTT